MFAAILISSLMILGPVAVVCGIAWWWSHRSARPTLARVLWWSAVGWMAGLTFLVALSIAVLSTCGGDIIYGLRDCNLVPLPVANATVATTALALVAGLAYAVLLFLAGAILEWRARS